MASFPKVATDFDQIIQADRQRKKNQELAKEIFSRNRQKDNKRRDDKRPGRPSTPTLASRVGITKRSSSTSSNNPTSRVQQRPRNSLPGHNTRATRLANEVANETTTLLPSQIAPQPDTTSNVGGGISIKGASGPFVLHASNFAPGTTAADIESALHPDTLYSNGISSLVSCKIVDTKPNVVAELVFAEKIVAENIIAKYNGQKADGRILRVELVRSGVGSMSKAHNQTQQAQRSDRRDRQQAKQQPIQTAPSLQPQVVPQIPEPAFEPEIDMPDDNAMEDIEMDAEPTTVGAMNHATAINTFDEEREAADRDRRDRDSRHIRGGHYDKRRGDDDRRRNDRDRDSERDRDHERERDRDRDRNRDRERDRDYERREERPRDDRRGTMTSHYGNGVGNNQRGGYSGGGGYGGYRGGRYGDGYNAGGGGRGSYRGGYRGYG